MRRDGVRFVPLLTIVVSAAWASRAAADNGRGDQCATASEEGQQLRDEGKLVSSRERFLHCASEDCPAVIRQDCIRWISEVETRTPTIVLVIRDEAGRNIEPRVSVDGAPFATLQGRASPIDPGAHVLRFELADAVPIEERVVVVEHEKGRVVAITLPSKQKTPPPAPPPTPAQPRQEHRGFSPLSLSLAGVTILGAIGFGYFWATGIDRATDLRDTCAPYCSQDDISDVRTKIVLADISLGVAITAAVGAVATYLFVPMRRR